MFGWYYDGCTVQDEDADVWALIGRAVPEAADDERLHALFVGEMVTCSIDELFNDEDVISMCDDGRLTADEIAEVVSERHGERVYDGRANLDDGDAKPALRRIVQRHRCAEDAAPEIVQWAREHITLDPSIACHGRRPLPIEYVEGEWIFGGTENEPAAVITYATEESMETGHVGWCWWALGRMGDAPSYEEAKARAEEVVRRVMDGPSCATTKPDAPPFGHISKADETQVEVCGKQCAHGSECLALPGHDGGHETQHGCVFYDERPAPDARGVCGHGYVNCTFPSGSCWACTQTDPARAGTGRGEP